MTYNEKYANSFKYGMMFGKDIKPGDEVKTSVTDPNDIVLAVKKAYIDMSPRTFRTEGSRPLDPKKKDALFEALAEKYADYMQKGAADFEEWHKELCVFFIQELKRILADAGKDLAHATYGKAQKIVNMTFKYLYCFDDAEKYAERFEPCHMAIDSYILNWVKGWYVDQYNEGKEPDEQLRKEDRISFPNWSHMTESGTAHEPQYLELQKVIRERVRNKSDMLCEKAESCIEAEFIIWYNERQKLSQKPSKT